MAEASATASFNISKLSDCGAELSLAIGMVGPLLW
jgi:hypothetical protein